uniref:Four helix bundle protein n=1 Tax=candidate division WOR-3 bacterium TaxID=2052148 RepID=A0A7C4Y4E2_UNCW3
MKPHKKLDIWGKSIRFVTLLYKKLQKFPNEEQFGLSMQLKRAAISIPSNIAEGAARKSKKDYVHYLYIARGSISEVDAQLEIARELGFLNDEDYKELQGILDELSKMLNGLINSLK